ncbi:MAG: hypothetical protein WCK94_11605 [Comamonadaceae bacterium]
MKNVMGMVAIATTFVAVLLCSGCAVVAVADTVVTVAATVVTTGVKAAGAAVNAVIPDSKKTP